MIPTRTKILKPSALVVLHLLRGYPDGMCRRQFAAHDVYEPAARLTELKRAGFVFESSQCVVHHHQRRMLSYRLVGHSDDA
jgi:hypothetical protein